MCSEILEIYRPIPVLFSLLSCSVPAIIKGAVLTAIARIVTSSTAADTSGLSTSSISGSISVRDEVWEYVESHRLLLPVPASQSQSVSSSTSRLLATSTNVSLISDRTQPAVLKTELEFVEARTGLYPITEGLLQVLEALICTGSGPVPNQLGAAYRTPGIVLYLEYLLDEVLFKAHERRYFKPQSSSSYPCSDSFVPMAAVAMSYAQRWRLCSRILRILSGVLQRYPVNVIPIGDDINYEEFLRQVTAAGTEVIDRDRDKGRDDEQSISSRLSIAETLLDFNIISSGSTGSSPTPKTAGFAVMTYLLGKPRFFSCVLSLLAESSDPSAFIRNHLGEVGTSLEIMQYIYSVHLDMQTIRARDRSEQEQDQGRVSSRRIKPTSLLLSLDGQSQGRGRSLGEGAGPRPPLESRISLLDSSGLGLHTAADDDISTAVTQCLCDDTFWREQFVSSAVGLLYECSLREVRFNQLLQVHTQQQNYQKRTPVQVLGTGQGASLPVLCEDLATLLSAGEGLSLLAQLLARYQPRLCPSLPSVPVLCVKLLQHVAVEIPPQRLLGALSTFAPPSSSHFRTLGGSASSGVSEGLISACASALLGTGQVDRWTHSNNQQLIFHLPADGQLQYEIIHRGAQLGPMLYSAAREKTFSNSVSVPPLPGVVRQGQQGQGLSASASYWQVKSCYLVSGSEGSGNSCFSIASAVMDLLLTTLTPRSRSRGQSGEGVCLSHMLLGLLDVTTSITSGSGMGSRSGAKSVNCLDAILELLSPQYFGVDSHTTLVQQCPSLAVDCFELLYRLCSTNSSSAATLTRLRSVHFLPTQLTILLYLMHLTDQEIEAGTATDTDQDQDYDQDDQESLGGSNGDAQQIKFEWLRRNRIEFVKSTILECMGWLLQICSLDIRHFGTSSAPLRAMLLGSCQSLSFAQERASDCSVLVKISSFAVDCLTIRRSLAPITPALPSPTIGDLLMSAAVVSRIGKAGRAFIQERPPSPSHHSTDDTALYDDPRGIYFQSIDFARFLDSLKARREALSKYDFVALHCVALASNAYSRRLAAVRHLTTSLRQSLDICLLFNRSSTTSQGIRTEINDRRVAPAVIVAERERDRSELQLLFSELLLPLLDQLPAVVELVQDQESIPHSFSLSHGPSDVDRGNGGEICEQLAMCVTSLVASMQSRSSSWSADFSQSVGQLLSALLTPLLSSNRGRATSATFSTIGAHSSHAGAYAGQIILSLNSLLKNLLTVVSSQTDNINNRSSGGNSTSSLVPAEENKSVSEDDQNSQSTAVEILVKVVSVSFDSSFFALLFLFFDN